MTGLVAYDSGSDEDEEGQGEIQTESSKLASRGPQSLEGDSVPNGRREHTSLAGTEADSAVGPADGTRQPRVLSPVLGPALGPSLPLAAASTVASPSPDADVEAGSKSPYTTTRNLLRDLTLPLYPDMDIPQSPSPPPPDSSAARSLAALNKKVDTFLKLKRQEGAAAAHFHDRLAASAPARNPALTDKLLHFAGIDEPLSDQYTTTLPLDIWDPAAFPGWAYGDELRKAAEKIRKERERGRGERVDFVAATAGSEGGNGTLTGDGPGGRLSTAGLGAGSRDGTPGAVGTGAVTGKRKTRFDT